MPDLIEQYRPIFEAAGQEWNIDPAVLMSLAKHEGDGDPNARGSSGEYGMMQIMPNTAAHLGITDIRDPVQQIYGAAKYMNEALTAEHENPAAALRYYNGGPGWRSGRGDPNYPGYVLGHYKQYAKADTGTMTDASSAPAPGAPPPAKDVPVAGNAPTADDLLERMRELAPSGGAPAADTPASSETPAKSADGTGAPSGDALLARMHELAPAPVAPKPGTPPGGPPPGEQMGVYSKAGQSAGMIPGQAATVTPPDTTPPAPEPGPSENKNAAENLLAAGTEAYRSSPPILTPGAREAVEASGWLGRNLLNPVLDAGGAVLGAGAAAGAVIGQGAYEAGRLIGGPSLGREFYIGSQTVPATMTMLPPGTRLPGVVGRTSEVPPRPATEPILPGVAEVAPEAQVRIAGNPKGPAEPLPPPPREAAPAGAAPAAGAQYAGPAPAATPAERVSNLEKSVVQTAEDRAGPQMRDDNRYVANIPDRTLAAQDFSDSVNALDEKVRMGQNPEFKNKVDAINRDRNRGMVDLLANDAKDTNALEAAHEVRQMVSPDEMGVFTNEQPVDASHNLAALDRVLASRTGKRDAVRSVLEKVRNSFLDADGNLETSPSQLYGVRQNITDLLKKGVKGTTDEADAVRASKSILTGLLPELDKTITEGAPEFQRYLQAWHELSGPIDRMEFLQKYQTGAKKITGGDGYLQLNKVQKMLDDVLQGNKARGPNAAKNLTDQEIANIEAVRNELAAQQLKDRLAATRGSDTFQQINRAGAFSGSVGHALAGAARMAGILGTGGTANLLYEHGIRPGIARRREARIAAATAARESALLGGIPPQQ